MKISLTQKSLKALHRLLQLRPEAFSVIADALATHLERLTSQAEVQTFASELKDVDPDAAVEVLDFLVPVCMSRLSRSTDYSEVVDAILHSATAAEGSQKFEPHELEALRTRLTEVFSSRELALKSKAIRLQTTHDKVFHKAEVLCDVRPVFASDGGLKIDALVRFHTLHIEFYQRDERHSFFCALDSQDLAELRKLLDREAEKLRSLDAMIKQTGIPRLEVE